MLELLIKGSIAYLLGSVSGALLTGRLFGGVDIRKLGSGNAGGTNALRTQGPLFALLVIVIDIGKGVLAVVLARTLPAFGGGDLPDHVLVGACGALAVVGHIWPVWHGFRGGKGAATLIGVYAAAAPMTLLVALPLWFACIALTGFVGLATMLAVTAAVAGVGALYPEEPGLWVMAGCLAALIVYAHRGNIARMRAGNENRMEKAMLFRRGRRQ